MNKIIYNRGSIERHNLQVKSKLHEQQQATQINDALSDVQQKSNEEAEPKTHHTKTDRDLLDGSIVLQLDGVDNAEIDLAQIISQAIIETEAHGFSVSRQLAFV